MRCATAFGLLVFIYSGEMLARERHESFDSNPAERWEGSNNRPRSSPVVIKQDFGYSHSKNASRTLGEVGGLIAPAGELAHCGKRLSSLTLNDHFSASGTMVVKKGGGNTLLGFYNPATANEWRTANTLVFRVNGRGEFFHVHVEYTTQKWRAGASVIGRVDQKADRVYPVEISSGDTVYPWSLEYDPAGNAGSGSISATFGTDKAICTLAAEHRADGAKFDHFGILNVMKSADGGGEMWIGDLTINGEKQDLSSDPKWDGKNDRATYETDDVRPWFNFGWSPTNLAGGDKAGEIGGRFFRGDCRYPERMAWYGDKLTMLSLEKPLKASGRLTLRRGVSDSTALFGFFHHQYSSQVNPAQDNGVPKDFVGIAIEGPSSEGFYCYPLCRGEGEITTNGFKRAAPRIYPDGVSHQWMLEYDPSASGGEGALTVTLDGQAITLELKKGMKESRPSFDRFGLVTPWIDGNEQIVYFDDLTYTVEQD